MQNFFQRQWKQWTAEPYLLALLFLAIATSALKKWEVGGSLDPIWYSAVSKNIALTGDYFNFAVSRHWFSSIADHMPMTYWTIGTLMRWFGVSDFVAKLYPIACSIATYFALFALGRRLKDEHYGFVSAVVLGLTFHFVKWSGQVKQEVPLTLFFLLTTLALIKAQRERRAFLWAGLWFFFGVMTKGPIIFAVPLAYFCWSLLYRHFAPLRSCWFWAAVALVGALGSLLLLPGLYFHGQNYYQFFYTFKTASGVLIPAAVDGPKTYFYYPQILLLSPIPLLLALPTIVALWQGKIQRDLGTSFPFYVFCFLISLATLLPLTLFQQKFGHYLVPIYPFQALLVAWPLAQWTRCWKQQLPQLIRGFTLALIIVMAIFPIQTSGKRTKKHINLINILKFETQLAQKQIYFLGSYNDDMDLVGQYSFYGDLHVAPIKDAQFKMLNWQKSIVIIPRARLPLPMATPIAGAQVDSGDCFLLNELFCVLLDRQQVQLQLPLMKLPTDLYAPHSPPGRP